MWMGGLPADLSDRLQTTFQVKVEPVAEECKPDPMEQEEKKPEMKTEVPEGEDRPTTPATQSSPAAGQSKKKSKQKHCFYLNSLHLPREISAGEKNLGFRFWYLVYYVVLIWIVLCDFWTKISNNTCAYNCLWASSLGLQSQTLSCSKIVNTMEI